MAGIDLRKLVSRNRDLISGVIDLIALYQMPISVSDMDGNVLINPTGSPEDPASEAYPIMIESRQLGLVKGGEAASIIARLLSSAANFEVAKKALGREVLDRYRELNLLYNLSEKLASSFHPKEVAMITLKEANRLILASLGAVLWTVPGAEAGLRLAAIGDEIALEACLAPTQSLARTIAQSGRAEIVNNLTSNDRLSSAKGEVHSMICVPLKIKTKVRTKILGTIFLANQSVAMYTAGDLELLNTVATQAAPVLEYAFLHEKELAEAREREAILRRQIQELRIELDEAREEQQVAEITETEYFKRLRTKAANLRHIMSSK
jgi:hypothetical protein